MNPDSNNDGKPPAKMIMKSIPRKKLPPVAPVATAKAPAAASSSKMAASNASSKPIPRRSLPSVGSGAAAASASQKSNAAGSSTASAAAAPTLHRLRKKKVKTSTRKLPLSSAAAAASASASASAPAPRIPRSSRASDSNHYADPDSSDGEEGEVTTKSNNNTNTGNSTNNTNSSFNNNCIRILREDPLILKVQTTGIPFTSGLPAGNRVSSRAPKRKRPTYQDWDELSDSDDYLSDSEQPSKSQKQRQRQKQKQQQALQEQQQQQGQDPLAKQDPSNASVGGASQSATGTEVSFSETAGVAVAAADGTMEPPAGPVINGTGDAPPPGVLSTLWYSRESFWHIFVLEKVVGWKTRTVFSVVTDPVATSADTITMFATTTPSTAPTVVPLQDAEAIILQQKALQNPVVWADYRRRMEISRIYPARCPVVLAMAAIQEEQLVQLEQEAYEKDPSSAPPPRSLKYRLEAMETREEIVLVKWRGRSHFHCSWERASDIQRLDPSNNTARNKIRRFYLSQEVAFGPEWKKILEEERVTAAKIHSHGVGAAGGSEEEVEQDDEYFPPQCLELERILACDENELNVEVLAKQRALNIRAEQEALRRREEADAKPEELTTDDHKYKATKAITAVVHGLIDVTKKDEAWDPEDNVRYVVKWKGLPYSEITWEYWRDIKGDAVDEVEDFWFRQKAPDVEEVRKITTRTHPHIRDFRKLQASAQYGISQRARPVADLGDGAPMDTEDDEVDPDRGFRLRSYQLEGVNWLLFNWWNKRSCILADEMGLGKTCQSICFIQELQKLPPTQVRGPFLIVAPLSLIGQWKSEFKSWAPDVNAVLYHGSADARDFLVKQEFFYTDQFLPKATAVKLKKQHVTKFHVLITTYEVALKDIAVISKIRWKALIVDEAHRLKNPRARLFEELATVPRDYCVLLTGTPIANATEELWALLHFANPSIFASKDSFLEKFGEMTDVNQVNELHNLLKPYLLRRVKEDVEKSLPPKEETILEVSLTPIQKKFYKAIYERNTSFLYKGTKPSNAPSLMNVMMELRKCCNHPYLVKGAEDRILAEAAAKLKEKKDADGNEVPINDMKLFEEQLVKSSGKMVLMEKLLQKLFDGGHKVLVFSQMVRVLDLLEELLKIKKYKYERLDGSTSSSARTAGVDRFTRKSCQRFVMLLSTRAGGLGLNLTAADIVVIFDSDWNPQNDLQAMARAHRIGQTRAVRVYRLLTAKTYEMHMFHSASLKLGLERAVLSQNREQAEEGDDSNNKTKKKTDREAQAKEIDDLLKKGAYDVFRDEDDTEAEKFMETDIDQLLIHSSKKVTYGDSATSSLGSGLGSFSKASFVANTDDGEKDVDLDDPDFWAKSIGLEAPVETSEDVAAMIDDGVKRNRKQVQVFDPYAEFAEAEQRKKDKILLERIMEKEEKERERLERKKKKKDAKNKRRKRDREKEGGEKKPAPLEKKQAPKKVVVDVKKVVKESRPKKKKNDRQTALRRAENEDPILERLRQAWEVPQRNRATAAAIRFGFSRLCKLRSESNFTSLPLQDLESFVRSYVYQLSLQVSVTLLAKLRESDAVDLRLLFQEWIGLRCAKELDWICNSVYSTMKFQVEVENRRRFLRMPVILAEPGYVAELRRGGAFRALRRIGILVRLNRFIEDTLDSILLSLGHEELGKRGCAANDLSTLEADLKSRYVTTEELALGVSAMLRKLKLKAPASWWDRSCDVALVIGTFAHGLGNYEAMRTDTDLPFAEKLGRISQADEASKTAGLCFRAAAAAGRQVFDYALESARVKAELEVQAAVAAAAKAASKREIDAALLRKGGTEAEAVISEMPDTQVENAFEFDGTDSHFVTLGRMQKSVQDAVRKEAISTTTSLALSSTETLLDPVKTEEDNEEHDDGTAVSRRARDIPLLSMPDARVLDHRLVWVLKTIEKSVYRDERHEPDPEESNPDLWQKSDDILTNLQVRHQVLSSFVGDDFEDVLSEYSGVGLGANQCGATHRSLNDGSDFSFGSASALLSQVAYGTDAPRFLRAIGVPMNVTRFAISGLVYAETFCLKNMLASEQLRYYGREEDSKQDVKEPAPKSVEGTEAPTPETVESTSVPAPETVESTSVTAPEPTDGPLVPAPELVKGTSVPAPKTVEGTSVPTPEPTEGTSVPAPKPVEGTATPAPKPEPVTSVTQVNPSEPELLTPSVTPIDPVELISDVFRENAKLRASVCLAVLFYGFPAESDIPTAVHPDLWKALLEQSGSPGETAPSTMFNMEKFRNAVEFLAADVEVPDSETLRIYVELTLLPHCLRLCINGNGPTTRNARGSQGEYETAFGVSLHPEPSQSHPSPLPDPCLSLQEHSLEALGQANALLRRVRLLRSSAYLCSCKEVSPDAIQTVAHSKVMGALEGMPVWWCPWIHDVALLVQAGTDGLFSVVQNRSNHAIFAPEALQQYLYSAFVADERALPASKHTPPEQVTAWTEGQANTFPSLNQLERRLAFLCSQATAGIESEKRYDNLPMFDHGGWPRN